MVSNGFEIRVDSSGRSTFHQAKIRELSYRCEGLVVRLNNGGHQNRQVLCLQRLHLHIAAKYGSIYQKIKYYPT